MWNWQIHSSLRHQNLPNTITKVILIVFTFALGMRPLELARLQSSLSRAIFRRLASVRGTEISVNISEILIRSLLPHLAGAGQPNIVRNVCVNWTGGNTTVPALPAPLSSAHYKISLTRNFSLQLNSKIPRQFLGNVWMNVYRFHFLKFLHKLTFIYIYYQFWQTGWSTIFLQTGFYRAGQWMGCNY